MKESSSFSSSDEDAAVAAAEEQAGQQVVPAAARLSWVARSLAAPELHRVLPVAEAAANPQALGAAECLCPQDIHRDGPNEH